DRFSDAPVVPFSQKQGLSTDRVNSVLSTADGSVWVGTFDGLNRWKDGKVTVYRDRFLNGGGGARFLGRSGRLWGAGHAGLARLGCERVGAVARPPEGLAPGVGAG